MGEDRDETTHRRCGGGDLVISSYVRPVVLASSGGGGGDSSRHVSTSMLMLRSAWNSTHGRPGLSNAVLQHTSSIVLFFENIQRQIFEPRMCVDILADLDFKIAFCGNG